MNAIVEYIKRLLGLLQAQDMKYCQVACTAVIFPVCIPIITLFTAFEKREKKFIIANKQCWSIWRLCKTNLSLLCLCHSGKMEVE
jgi:hypothetical protein